MIYTSMNSIDLV